METLKLTVPEIVWNRSEFIHVLSGVKSWKKFGENANGHILNITITGPEQLDKFRENYKAYFNQKPLIQELETTQPTPKPRKSI